MKTKLKKWKKIKSTNICNDSHIQLDKDLVILPSGKKHNYFHINKGMRSVFVFAFNRSDRLLVTKQYRYPIDQIAYGPVGGMVEKNETPLRAAKRELKEETGYTAKSYKLIGSFYASPANSNGIFFIYTAKDLKPGEPNPDDTEFIECEFLPKTRIDSMIKSGEWRDSDFMAAWMLYKLK